MSSTRCVSVGFARVRCFAACDRGAVTIDWVALTAGILLLGIVLIYALFNNGVASTASNINANLSAAGASVDVGAAPSQGTFGGATGSDAGGSTDTGGTSATGGTDTGGTSTGRGDTGGGTAGFN